jgi:hypothetical protein
MPKRIGGFAFALAVLASGHAGAQTAVSGTVVDPRGSPVPGAFVEALPITKGGFAASLSWKKTDDHGKFSLSLGEGRYEIRAKDESEGYPDPNALLSVNADALFPEISVSDRELRGIKVRLGPKGGTLDGDVRDKTTEKPISKAKITIRDPRNPQAFVEVFADKDGRFQFTVPPKAVVVSVTAPGYETGYFENGRELDLSGGERRTITLEVEPR